MESLFESVDAFGFPIEEESIDSIGRFASTVTALARKLGFESPDKAYWQCNDFSKAAHWIGKELGLQVRLYSAKVQFRKPNGEINQNEWVNHVFLKIGDTFYDWTARQFMPDSDFPHVTKTLDADYKSAHSFEPDKCEDPAAICLDDESMLYYNKLKPLFKNSKQSESIDPTVGSGGPRYDERGLDIGGPEGIGQDVDYEKAKSKNRVDKSGNLSFADDSKDLEEVSDAWKKEGYTIGSYVPWESIKAPGFWKVWVRKDGKEVGHISVWKDEDMTNGGGIAVQHVQIHPDHRRKGLATALYQYAEKETGLKLAPASALSDDPDDFSADAKALWSQPNRPFGESDLDEASDAWKKAGIKLSHKMGLTTFTKIPTIAVMAETPDGEVVGMTEMEQVGNDWEPQSTNVDNKYQRMGIASAMYAYAKKETNMNVVPSQSQTTPGKALWSKGMDENKKTYTSDDVLEYLDKISPPGEYLDNQYYDIGQNANWELKSVPMSKLYFSPDDVSEQPSKDTIKSYSKMTTKIPPIIVIPYEGDRSMFRILDGYHRVAVGQMRGDKEIDAYVPVKLEDADLNDWCEHIDDLLEG